MNENTRRNRISSAAGLDSFPHTPTSFPHTNVIPTLTPIIPAHTNVIPTLTPIIPAHNHVIPTTTNVIPTHNHHSRTLQRHSREGGNLHSLHHI